VELDFLKAVTIENNEENIQIKLKHFNTNVLPFYKEHGQPIVFLGKNNVPLSCRFFPVEDAKAKIFIATGYNESYFKYAETIYDLCKRGYSVYCYDHRGQGFSGRFPNQNKRGYVDLFSYFVEDLAYIFYKVSVRENPSLPVYVFAHSMGGAVVAHALAEHKITPKAAFLFSPMMGLHLTPFQFLETSIYSLAKISSFIGFEKSFAFFQKDCEAFLPFDGNDVTHSKFRFLNWRKNIAEISQLQIGGVTFGWLYEALRATRNLKVKAKDIKVPVTLFQAKEDTVVQNTAQDYFVTQCSVATKIEVAHARHEIFMEVDFIRDKIFKILEEMLV
jgi:lysophospholipase